MPRISLCIGLCFWFAHLMLLYSVLAESAGGAETMSWQIAQQSSPSESIVQTMRSCTGDAIHHAEVA